MDLLTTIIFTASGGHSATNNGQYDVYGYIPNAPGQMVTPPPRSREPLSEESLAAALPKGKGAAEQIATARLLSLPTESPLGHYQPRFFAGTPRVMEMVIKFEKQLGEVSQAIEARNMDIEVPYEYLDPRMLYPSVEI